MLNIAAIRSQMPAVTARAYFNTGTFGPFPRVVRDAMEAHLQEAHERGRIGEDGYATWAQIEIDARSAIATTVNASVGEIAVAHSTSDGLNLVVGGLEWEPGDEVLVGDNEHPGLLVPLEMMGQRRGIVTRVLPISDAPDPAGVIAEAITPRTRLVALSHVLWTTGRVLPVAKIAEVVHAAGALIIVDAAQGPGCIPVDAPSLGVDFYTISGQKWLCGPSGTGGLYVRPESLDLLTPAFPGYLTMEKHADGPRPWGSARRLDPGTSTLTALASLRAAVRWRSEIGWQAGHARALALAADLRARISGLDAVQDIVVDNPSPLVALRVDGMPADQVVAELDRRDVLVRTIPGTGITRISVGLWNDESDLDRLVSALAEVTGQ